MSEAATHEDWFFQAMRNHADAERARATGPVSASWSRWRPTGNVVRDLIAIREVARGIARVHGVPAGCRVDIATLDHDASGLAGFEDIESFSRPYILLDKAVYASCPADEVLDVYCGIVLHEAAHIRESRQIYKRLSAPDVTDTLRVYENLWEDERIEGLARIESPGFAPYIDNLKRVLFDQGDVGQTAAKWDSLPDMDKLNALIFSFVRCPHLIGDEMRRWQTLGGECVFDTLRALFPGGPETECDVERFARNLEGLWQRHRKAYDELLADNQAKNDAGAAGEEADRARRVERQRQADLADRLSDCLADEFETIEEAIERLFDEAEQRLLEGANEAADELIDAAIQLADLATAGDAAGRKALPSREDRFGAQEVKRAMDRFTTVCRPLDETEAGALERLERKTVADDTDRGGWKWRGERRTIVTCPTANDDARAAFDSAHSAVREHVAAMRAALAFRLGQRTIHQRQQRSGRIDRGRLATAPFNDRIFRRSHVKMDRGLALCLLLDESGSMAFRAGTVLKVAVLVAESLRGASGVELEIYSHTSAGPTDRDCAVRYLYGKQNPTRASIGCYGGRLGVNYDHQAILTAADLFMRNTRNGRRVMLVVSDGAPCGVDYGGRRAITETRKAVETVRGRGISVTGVAIADYACEAIYGAAGVLRFTDMTQLVADMRKLVTGIVRRA